MRNSLCFLALVVLLAAPSAAQEPPVIFEDLRIDGPYTGPGPEDGCDRGLFGWSVAVEGDLLLVGCSRWVTAQDHDAGGAYAYRRTPGPGEAWDLEGALDVPEGAVAFGYTVALVPLPGGEKGEALALITGRGNDDGSADGSAFVFRREADGSGGFAWVQEAELVRPTASGSVYYGEDGALAVTPGGEAVALVGVPNAGGGAVAVFRREGTGSETEWVEEAVLGIGALAPEEELEPGDFFGHAVGFDGVRAVVGAVGFDAESFDPATWLGAAWVYRRSGSGAAAVWAVEGRLIPEEAEEELRGDRYGLSAAMDGEWAAVGAPYDSNEGKPPDEWDLDGAVHVFRREGDGSWTPVQKLVNDDGNFVQFYGWSLAMRRGVLFTGMDFDVFAPNISEGSVRVWTHSATGVWTEEAVLRPSDIATNNYMQFGGSVSYDGTRAVVGAPEGFAAYIYGPDSLPVASEPTAPPATAAALSVPYPNPFRERTTLTLHLNRAQPVEAALYDLLGRCVRLLHRGPLVAGEHWLQIMGTGLTPGLYLLRVTGEDFAHSQRLIHVR